MAGKLRFRGMTLPTTGSFTQKFFSIPAQPGATGRKELSGWNDCRMPVSASWSGLSDLLDGTLIQVLDTDDSGDEVVVDEFVASRIPRELRTGSTVTVTGPQIGGLTQRIGVYPPDYGQRNPSRRPNWVWAGENVAGPLELADLGSTRTEYEVYLSGERYEIDMSSATDGTFTLTVGGNTTDPIDYDASASTIKSELEGLAGISSVTVIQEEDSLESIVCFENPKNLGTDMTLDDSSITGFADFAKITDGFDTGSDPTFTITVDGQTTGALDWDATANEVEGTAVGTPSGLQGLSNVDDVTVSGSGVFGDPWVITFIAPPTVSSLSVTFAAGTDVTVPTVSGALDPSPITISKPVDAGTGDSEQYGSYGNPPISVETDEPLNGDSDWTLRVNANSGLAGSQMVLNVQPGEIYSTVSVPVYPTTDAEFALVVRDAVSNALLGASYTDLSADSYQTVSLSDPVVIPDGTDQVIMRLAISATPPNASADIDHFFVSWQDAQFIEGLPAANPGDIVKTLLEWAQDQGDGEWLDVSFDDTNDTGSTAWPEEFSYQADGFAMYLSDVLADMTDRFGVEWTITPKATPSGSLSHDLNLWVSEGAGTDRTTSGPALMAGGAIAGGQVVDRISDFTRLVGWGADDLYVSDENATTKASFGQLTKFVDAEELANSDSIQEALDTAFADEESNRKAGVAKLRGGSVTPFVHFGLGDTLVWQAQPAMSKNERRVQTISWEHGNPVAEYEVQGSRVWGEAAPLEALIRLLDKPKKRKRPKHSRREIERPNPGGVVGAHIHLKRASAQSISGGSPVAISWDTLGLIGARNFSVSVPTDEVTIQEPGYYTARCKRLDADWDFTGDKTLSVVRVRGGSEVTVWESTVSDPVEAIRGGVGAIPCESGDAIKVYLEHSDGSAHDVSGDFELYLVDRTRVGQSGDPDFVDFDTDFEADMPGSLVLTLDEAPAEGDVLVLAIATAGATAGDPSGDGWEMLAQEFFSSGDDVREVWVKECGSGESDTVTVDVAAAALIRTTVGLLIHLTDVDPDPVTDYNSGTGGEGLDAPSVSTQADGLALVVWLSATGHDEVPSPLTEIVQLNTPGGVHPAAGWMPTTGADVGPFDISDDGSGTRTFGMTLAFAPRSI